MELFAKISSLQPVTAIWCGDPTWIAPNFEFLKMCNFNIYVVHLGFGAILGDPKFGSFHVGSPHHMAVTGYTWLIVVINSNNELCSCSNNTVSKAFWRKKVLPEQKISCCGVISFELTVHFNYEMIGKHFTETSNKVELRINYVRINLTRPVVKVFD